MAKKTRKKASKKKTSSKKSAAKKGATISSTVIAALEADKNIDNDALTAKVQAKFPDSAFNNKHASWYRAQFKIKALPKQKGYVKPENVKKVKKTSKKKVGKKKAGKKKAKKKKQAKKAA